MWICLYISMSIWRRYGAHLRSLVNYEIRQSFLLHGLSKDCTYGHYIDLLIRLMQGFRTRNLSHLSNFQISLSYFLFQNDSVWPFVTPLLEKKSVVKSAGEHRHILFSVVFSKKRIYCCWEKSFRGRIAAASTAPMKRILAVEHSIHVGHA